MPRLMIRFEINMMTKLSFLKSFDYISQPHHLVTENFLCEFLQLQLRGGAVVLVGTFQLLMQGAWTSLVGLVEACVDNRLMHDRFCGKRENTGVLLNFLFCVPRICVVFYHQLLTIAT